MAGDGGWGGWGVVVVVVVVYARRGGGLRRENLSAMFTGRRLAKVAGLNASPWDCGETHSANGRRPHRTAPHPDAVAPRRHLPRPAAHDRGIHSLLGVPSRARPPASGSPPLHCRGPTGRRQSCRQRSSTSPALAPRPTPNAPPHVLPPLRRSPAARHPRHASPRQDRPGNAGALLQTRARPPGHHHLLLLPSASRLTDPQASLVLREVDRNPRAPRR